MAALPFQFLEKLEDPSFSFPYTPCPVGWYFKIYPESSPFTATLKVPCRHHFSPGLPQQPPVWSPCSHTCPTSKLFSVEVRSCHAPGQASSPITHSLKAEVYPMAHRSPSGPLLLCTHPCCSSPGIHARHTPASGLCRGRSPDISPLSSLCSSTNFSMTPPLTTLLNTKPLPLCLHSLPPLSA